MVPRWIWILEEEERFAGSRFGGADRDRVDGGGGGGEDPTGRAGHPPGGSEQEKQVITCTALVAQGRKARPTRGK